MSKLLDVTVYTGCNPNHCGSLDIVIAGRWHFCLDVGLSVSAYQVRILANGDMILRSEEVAADDWRNQPLRPNGLPWK